MQEHWLACYMNLLYVSNSFPLYAIVALTFCPGSNNDIALLSQATNTVAPLLHPADEGAIESTTYDTTAADPLASTPTHVSSPGPIQNDLKLTIQIHF